MRTKLGLFQTQAFRIVLVYVLLFAFSVTALLFFTYWNTRRTLDGATDQIIEAEITGLQEEYQHFGLQGVAETLRAQSLHSNQSLYFLSDALHHFENNSCRVDRLPASGTNSRLQSTGVSSIWNSVRVRNTKSEATA